MDNSGAVSAIITHNNPSLHLGTENDNPLLKSVSRWWWNVGGKGARASKDFNSFVTTHLEKEGERERKREEKEGELERPTERQIMWGWDYYIWWLRWLNLFLEPIPEVGHMGCPNRPTPEDKPKLKCNLHLCFDVIYTTRLYFIHWQERRLIVIILISYLLFMILKISMYLETMNQVLNMQTWYTYPLFL